MITYKYIRLCIDCQYIFIKLYIFMKSSILIHMTDIDIKNEIKAVIYESGHSLNEVAAKLGISDTSLSNMLSRRSVRYTVAKQIADAIGYELKFRRKE